MKIAKRTSIRGMMHDIDIISVVLGDIKGYRSRDLVIVDGKIYQFVLGLSRYPGCNECVLLCNECDNLCTLDKVVNFLGYFSRAVKKLYKEDRDELMSSMLIVRYLYKISISKSGVYG